MSTLLDYARRELAIASEEEDLAVEPEIARGIEQVIRGFAGQGHSGGSAAVVGPRVGYVVGRLLAFEPITPLTGEDHEWVDVGEAGDFCYSGPKLEQNRRCSRVFREWPVSTRPAPVVFDSEAVVFVDLRDWLRGRGDVAGYTAWDSARRVSFPYTPPQRSRRVVFRRLNRLVARLRGQLRP